MIAGTNPSRAPFAIAVFVLLFARHAVATEVEPDPDRCKAGEFQFCLDGVTSSVTSVDLVRVTGARAGDVLSGREGEPGEGGGVALFDRDGQRVTGRAAGDLLGTGWGLWTSYSYSDFESTNKIAPYDGTLHSFLFGVDRLFADRLLFGVAGGYEIADTDTFYNAGGQETDGFTVAPYAAFLLNQYFSIDASGGYSWLHNKTDRVHPTTLTRVTADFDSERWFAMTHLNANYLAGNWVFGGRVGLLYAREIQDGYTETGAGARTVLQRTVSVTQFVTGIDIGYMFGAFEPYALFNYRNDLASKQDRKAGGLPAATGETRADDNDEFEIGFGVRYFGRQGLSGSVEWFKTLGRKEFDNHSVLATLRLDF